MQFSKLIWRYLKYRVAQFYLVGHVSNGIILRLTIPDCPAVPVYICSGYNNKNQFRAPQIQHMWRPGGGEGGGEQIVN